MNKETRQVKYNDELFDIQLLENPFLGDLGWRALLKTIAPLNAQPVILPPQFNPALASREALVEYLKQQGVTGL